GGGGSGREGYGGKTAVGFGGALVVALAFGGGARNPPFPQKGVVEITVLFPAGSSADVTARLLADGMSKQLEQRVIVVNRPGAGGADGYTHGRRPRTAGYSLAW